MSLFLTAILYLGAALQVSLAGLIVAKRLWRTYPFFSACVFWSLARTLLLFAVPMGEYTGVYWTTNSIDLVVRFFIVWELVSNMFPKTTSVITLFSRGFGVLAITALVITTSLVWSYETYLRSHSLNLAMERSFSFAQAVITLVLLLAVTHYRIPLLRPLRAMGIAFGAWTSIRMFYYALVDMDRSLIPYWQVATSLSYVALLTVWIWVAWKLPSVVPVREQLAPAPELTDWADKWRRTQSSLWRIKS